MKNRGVRDSSTTVEAAEHPGYGHRQIACPNPRFKLLWIVPPIVNPLIVVLETLIGQSIAAAVAYRVRE